MDSYQIDKKLEPILAEMHQVGVKIDVDFLNNLDQEIGLKILKLESEIYNSIGHEFNINSPSQMAKVLYEELKISPSGSGIRKRKTHHSTSADDLAKIEGLHPVIPHILKYRELNKLKTTYLESLTKIVDENNRIHTTYTVDTATGRLSSRNPNLQNIPIRTELGNKIREAFIAKKGYKLLVCDYSQIELRIAAHFSEDPEMMKVFNEGKDIHSSTAAELGVDRRTAKVVNFSILYGVSAYGLSETLKILREDAEFLINKYYTAYPRLAEYIAKTIKLAERDGYVETMFGRRRLVPELKSTIGRVRKFGERVAINTPFQGTAAEIIKLAMIEISKKFQSEVSIQKLVSSKKILDTGFQILDTESAKLILQVHDELVFEVPESDIDKISLEIKDIMENPVKLKVPLVVDVKIGKNWGELEKF
jgi:DNA polymerase-1